MGWSDSSIKDCSLPWAAYHAPIEINIRKAELRDAPVIADYNLRLALETEDLHLEPASVEAGVLALLKDAAKGYYYVAEVSGQVVGQLMITYEWSDWRNANIWWLQSVYVKLEFRRRGIFRALFSHLERLARNAPGVCGLRLYMHADNARARRSYLDLGMRQTKYEVFELDFRGHA
jgi:GNAT superfamily N-acetyltransferase